MTIQNTINLANTHYPSRRQNACNRFNSAVLTAIKGVAGLIFRSAVNIGKAAIITGSIIANRGTNDPFKQGLQNWCDQVQGTPEYQCRITAMQRILSCQSSKSNHLDLSGLRLTSLPPEIGQLTQLTSLGLIFTRLTSLPPEIGQLTQLTSLNLSNNQLNFFPPEIGQLTQLTYLDLMNNRLTSLPPEIGQLTQLTKLLLMGNQLNFLPPEIGQLTQLTSLDLGCNQLASLPREIGQLTQLTRLSLWGNQLTSLASIINSLRGLTELYLGANPIDVSQIASALPINVSSLSNLHTLTLDDSVWRAAHQANLPFVNRLLSPSGRSRLRLSNVNQLSQLLLEWLNIPGNDIPDLYQALLKHKEHDTLASFLKKLKMTADYQNKNTRALLVQRVQELLKTAAENEKCRELLFAMLGEVLTSCGDRVALGLIDIETSFRLANSDALNDKEFADLVIRSHRAAKLDKYIVDYLKKYKERTQQQHREEVEVAAHFKTALADFLPYKPTQLLYSNCSGLTVGDIEDARKMILQGTETEEDRAIILSQNDLWRTRLDKHQEYEKRYTAYGDQIDDLLMLPGGSSSSSVAAMNEQQKFDRIKELSEEKDKLVLEFTIKLLKSFNQAAPTSSSAAAAVAGALTE